MIKTALHNNYSRTCQNLINTEPHAFLNLSGELPWSRELPNKTIEQKVQARCLNLQRTETHYNYSQTCDIGGTSERQSMVFIDKWSLFSGYFVLFYKRRVLECGLYLQVVFIHKWPLIQANFRGVFLLGELQYYLCWRMLEIRLSKSYKHYYKLEIHSACQRAECRARSEVVRQHWLEVVKK